MKKIPTLYLRDEDDPSILTHTVHPDCQWVLDGEGRATVKMDGMAVLIEDGVAYKRREVKEGEAPPEGWLHWDLRTREGFGHGWMPIDELDPVDSHIRFATFRPYERRDGTYEVVGPKIQGNPHQCLIPSLFEHGTGPRFKAPTGRYALRYFLKHWPWEGIVWHHPDGRMAKI